MGTRTAAEPPRVIILGGFLKILDRNTKTKPNFWHLRLLLTISPWIWQTVRARSDHKREKAKREQGRPSCLAQLGLTNLSRARSIPQNENLFEFFPFFYILFLPVDRDSLSSHPSGSGPDMIDTAPSQRNAPEKIFDIWVDAKICR